MKKYCGFKGIVSSDHIHIEYAPKQSVSYLVKQFNGRTSRKLQQEFSKINDVYWGKHFWATGYGVWSTNNITDEMVNEYLEHHRKLNSDNVAKRVKNYYKKNSLVVHPPLHWNYLIKSLSEIKNRKNILVLEQLHHINE